MFDKWPIPLGYIVQGKKKVLFIIATVFDKQGKERVFILFFFVIIYLL